MLRSSPSSSPDEELRKLAPLLIKLERLREQRLDAGVCLILPNGYLEDAVQVFGMKVIHADVSKPMLGVTDE